MAIDSSVSSVPSLLKRHDTGAVFCSKAPTKQSDELSLVLSNSSLSCAVLCADLLDTDDVCCARLRDGRCLNAQQLRRLLDQLSMNEADATPRPPASRPLSTDRSTNHQTDHISYEDTPRLHLREGRCGVQCR